MRRKIFNILSSIASAKVLGLGDLILDRYVYGQADRLSPEAPVPVVAVERLIKTPGGLGNVALNLRSLGASPIVVGLVGDDQEGQNLERILSPSLDPLSPPFLRDPSRQTTVKTRVVAGIQQIVRFDEESNSPLAIAWQKRLIESLTTPIYGTEGGLIGACQALILSDYAKGALPPIMLKKVIALAQSHNKPVVIDPKGLDFSRYRGATVVTPNRRELALAYGQPLDLSSSNALAEAARQMMSRCGLKNILITRSEDGMTLVKESGGIKHLPTKAREVFDVTGAGDTVVAAVSAALAAGLPLEDGAELATLAASVVVAKVGAASASTKEIEDAAKYW
ncbi:MAG: D-glycero-beta-D-manno-heptose-7-phosphate kinase [Deltaproteobacteria bacterium]|jgi:D-beta-D-heptose 7-phosphate kinase/D-beta-D-heptose 1-phosphate adenosyltransferase|nr:D-glycero-beta-D-manno-heptose-7-phosphate kinase [Deltaproteobacteria bacterium]